MRENLENKLRAYAKSDAYAFHMPGHKRIMDPLGGAAVKLDITEIDGFDNLHDAEGVLRDEMDAAAEMYGAKETLFSVNGSTCALLAAVSAAVPRGGTLLIERACHMAVYHAAYLRELNVLYAEDLNVEDLNAEDLNPKDLNPENPNPKAGSPELHFDAVVITSPTYEGCMKDVEDWAAFAHAHGAALIVDEAHGAHLGFHPYFPESAVRCGADVVVQSTHKTLPAMTQTALLHNVTGCVSGKRLQFFMDIYETSSPSYVLMASITGALRMVRDRGDELFGKYAERLKWARRELCSLKHFGLAGGVDAVISRENELPPYGIGTRMDPGKLVLVPAWHMDVQNLASTGQMDPGKLVLVPVGHMDVQNLASTGQMDPGKTVPVWQTYANARTSRKYNADWLYGVLRDEYHLQMEMRTDSYCLAMTSFADTNEGFGRLVAAMREIDERVERELAQAEAARGAFAADPEYEASAAEADHEVSAAGLGVEPAAGSFAQNERILKVPVVRANVGSKIGMRLSDALDADTETIALSDAAGRVCADFVILYPPDVPLIVPGEMYTEAKIAEIRMWIEKGFSVIGVDL